MQIFNHLNRYSSWCSLVTQTICLYAYVSLCHRHDIGWGLSHHEQRRRCFGFSIWVVGRYTWANDPILERKLKNNFTERRYWEVTNQKRALISFCNRRVSPPLHKDDLSFFNGVWKKFFWLYSKHTQNIRRDISSRTELCIQERWSRLGAISRHKLCKTYVVVNKYTIDILVTVQILQHWTLWCNLSCQIGNIHTKVVYVECRYYNLIITSRIIEEDQVG